MPRSAIVILISVLLTVIAFSAGFRMEQKMANMPGHEMTASCISHCLFSKYINASGDTVALQAVWMIVAAIVVSFVAISLDVRKPIFLPSVVPKDPRRLLTIMKRE